jgi:glycosyltransferase involved in cell wall biosynthesis
MKISIIVPVYNTAQFLPQCIESILQQTYKNLEIILVDDGSTDGSGMICDTYAKRDERIKVIHKKNGGLSEARNVGLQYATGMLIGFVDSDDLIHPQMYELLEWAMEKENSPIVFGTFLRFSEEEELKQPTHVCKDKMQIENFQPEAVLRKIILHEMLEVVWDGLYRRDVIGDTQFDYGRKYEDSFWTHKIVGQAEKISVISYPLYAYRQREGSIMAEDFSLRDFDRLEAKLERLSYCEQHYPALINLAKSDLYVACMNFQVDILRQLKHDPNRKEAQKMLDDYRKQCRMNVWALIREKEKLPVGRIICFLFSKISFKGASVLKTALYHFFHSGGMCGSQKSH